MSQVDYARLRRNLQRRRMGSRIVVNVYQKGVSPPRHIEQVATFCGFLREDSYHHVTDGQWVAVLVDGERTLRVLHFSHVLRSAPRSSAPKS